MRYFTLVLLAATIPANAGPVTWEYAGEITAVNDYIDLFGSAITVGTPFSGYFTFESSTPNSSTDSTGRYEDAILDTAGQIGDLAFLFV